MKARQYSQATARITRESRFNSPWKWGGSTSVFATASGSGAHPISYQMPGSGFYTRNKGLGHNANHSNNAAG
jgi:hypothetical protein